MYKKRIISYVMLLVLLASIMSLFVGCSTEQNIPIPTVEDDTYIYDEDDVIDDEVEASLNTMLVELEEKTGIEFAVISVSSLLNKSIEEYSNEVFNTLGIGKKDEDNGILLLFSKSDTRVRLEIGLGLEGLFNDSKCGRILDKYFVPYREKDAYTEATEMTVKSILSILAKEYEIEIEGLENFSSIEEDSGDDSLTSTIIIIIVIIIIIFLFIVYWSDDDFHSSGGFYSSSSRSFSDSSSSRSFSGGSFGGGFSGGGGASR